MATIIDRPSGINLLRNLKSFILESSSEVTFRLGLDGEYILEETYFPDANNRIEIDIRDVVARHLKTNLPNTNVFTQSDALRLFIAYEGSNSMGFAVLTGGVRKLTEPAADFLEKNWLTWQPQTKHTTWGSPEYLTYYFGASAHVKAKFYRKNGTTKTVTIHTQNATGELRTFNTGMGYLFSLSGEEIENLYGIVDVWVEHYSSGQVLSYVQRYVYEPTQGNEKYFLCINSLGGIDTFTFHGAQTLKPEIEHEAAESGSVKQDITSKAERKWQQSTGYQGTSATKWLFELLASSKAWAIMDSNAEAIIIDTDSVSMNDHDNLHSCEFDFTLAEEGRLLNIRRTDAELPVIEVPSPAGDIFFLRARLSDYPDAELEETILFLVQSPYSETWSKASLGAIRNWILNTITQSEIGLHAHSHDNKGVLDRFGLNGQNPTFDGQALAFLEDALRKFLRKDIADHAAGKITIDDAIEFGEFISGLAGRGGRIDSHGAAELRSLILNEWLEVPELRCNRVSVEIGNQWSAPGGGIIEDVSVDEDALGQPLPTGIITLHLEDGEIGAVAVDDLCQGIFHDGLTLTNNADIDLDDSVGNFKFAGFFTAYFRVTEILDGRNQRFRYALRGVSESWPHSFHPCSKMHFVAYGNPTNTDRQNSRYSTRTYLRFLTGVNDWEFRKANIAAQFGQLDNLSVFGLQMSGYSMYLNNIYMTGTIEQLNELPLRLVIETGGDNFLAWGETMTVTCRLWRGFYEDITDQVTEWSIVRESGDATEDAAWLLKQKVQNFSGTIDICFTPQENDLGGNEYTVSTLFRISASIQGDDSAEANLII